jgi:hypothetical protein
VRITGRDLGGEFAPVEIGKNRMWRTILVSVEGVKEVILGVIWSSTGSCGWERCASRGASAMMMGVYGALSVGLWRGADWLAAFV